MGGLMLAGDKGYLGSFGDDLGDVGVVDDAMEGLASRSCCKDGNHVGGVSTGSAFAADGGR